MKKFVLPVIGLVASLLTAQAQYFTTGNLAVVRIGGTNQSVTTSGGGNQVWIDQYTTSGTLVSSLALPTNGATAFNLNGLAYSGLLSVTPDGTHLVLGGFNTNVPFISNGVVQNVAYSRAVDVPRAIATIDGYGNYAMPVANSDIFSTYTITSATSDGSNFWAAGTGGTPPSLGGVVYCGTALVPATNEVATGLFGRALGLNIFNNALYACGYPASASVSPQSGAFELANISGSLPTTSTAFSLPIPTGTNSTDTPYDLAINPAGTIAYVADSTAGIVKFTNNAGTWVSNYTVVLTNAGYASATASSRATSVTADFTQTPPVVYATTFETITNRLVLFQDNGVGSTVVNLASNLNVLGGGTNGATNTFRGVRFVPGSVPIIASQPSGVVQSADGSATFSVSVTGSSPLSYQWYTNSVAVSGANSSSLTLSTLTTFENGTVVSVVVTNAYGTATSSNATLTVNPDYFIPGNLAVVSVGGSGQWINASDSGNTVSILQFTTNAGQSGPVSTLSLPSTGPNAFVLDGSATEGFMSLSPNGQYLVLGGYNAALPLNVGTNILEYSTSSNAPRAVVTIDGYGNYAMPIANTNVYNTYNIRGAAFDGTNNFWVSGGGSLTGSPTYDSGIIYVGTPGSSGVNVRVGYTGTGNERVLNIYNNTLYAGTGSSTHGIWAITGSGSTPPTGLPTNIVNTITQASTTGPYDFVFDPANTTCYVADGNLGGIIKYTNNAGTWVSNYLIRVGGSGSSTNAGGVTADFTQNPPVIYATTSELAGNRLISIVDTGASATFSVLATASSSASGSNYFRGVRFVPGVPPSIATAPVTFTQDAGGNATFTVGATGTPTLTYQWYTNGVAVSGATNATLTLNSVTLGESGVTVTVVITNAYGSSTSTGVLLNVQPPGAPLNVSISPISQTVSAGASVALNASAVGTSLNYIWKLNGVTLSDGGSVSGSSTATLTINPAYATYNGTYSVIASNSFGTATNSTPATLTVIDPVILSQPAGATNMPSTSYNLSVTAAGAPTLTYQWYSNTLAVSGATGSSFNIVNGGNTTSASYYVVVSNGLGNSITSSTTSVAFSPLLLNETFPYPNGNLFTESPWTDINGSNPQMVASNRGIINESNATTDAQMLFTQPAGNNVMWASFIVNLTSLPTNAGGVYFANIEDTNFNFFGRIFCLSSNQSGFTPNIPNTAFTGTYRLGIADSQGDSAGTSSTGPSAVVPLDLAPGIDYRVVYYVDFNGQVSGMAVNPASLADVTAYSPGGVSSGAASDSFAGSGSTEYTNQLMNAFGMRQRQGEGVMQIANIKVSYDWNGGGSGYAAVTSGMVATNPVIGLQPIGTTNYTGNPFTMEVAASGIGASGVGLTYAWYQNGSKLSDGGNITGSTTPTLSIASLDPSNSGPYYVTVKGAYGSAVQSSNTVISVNTTPTAPIFTVQPAANTTNSEGGSVTLDSLAVGTGPITYAWYCISDGNTNQVGSGADLSLTGLNTNQSGTYYVVATGDNGALQTQSSNAVLIVNGPKSVTIGYLRSLLNPTTYQPSDMSTLFSITGTITTATNLTTGNTSSCYIQDSTGGLNLFVTMGSDFRPALGDLVTATGTLSSYVDNYELDVTEGNNGYVDSILAQNQPLPTPIFLQWGYTAPLPANIATNVEGSVVYITNLYFEAYTPGGSNVFKSGTDYVVTNQTGLSYTVFVSDQDTGYVTGQPLPAFASSIAGPLIQDDATVGIQFTVYSNMVIAAPAPPVPPTCPTACLTGTPESRSVTLAWTAVPSSCTYSVMTATNLQGPWTMASSGLCFTTTNGAYCDTAPTNTARFYMIVSP